MAEPRKTLGILGILGGGQLGVMLADAAQRLQDQGLISDFFIQALPSDPAWALYPARAVSAIPPQATHLVFENEFLNCDALEAQGGGLRFHPPLSRLRPLQDKLEQKRILSECGIPSAPYCRVRSREELAAAHDQLGDELVLKWSRQGYDGKGVFPISRGAPFPTDFFAKPVYAEARVDFVRELAIVACRMSSGQLLTYPLVVSEQASGICRRVSGPATRSERSVDLESTARGYAERLAQHTGLEGVFAVELFETRDGRLLVNEIAPRVHNSGHFTLDACPVSQFEAHLRACLDLPLTASGLEAHTPFVMLNLLGPAESPVGGAFPFFPPTRDLARLGFPPLPTGMHLHWYGKTEARPGRKLGHLNALGAAGAGVETISVLAAALEDYHELWKNCLNSLKLKIGDT